MPTRSLESGVCPRRVHGLGANFSGSWVEVSASSSGRSVIGPGYIGTEVLKV